MALVETKTRLHARTAVREISLIIVGWLKLEGW
jgi:hypothetical protein